MARRTVKVKKYSDVIEEKAAAAAITPGMLLEKTSSDTVQAHSTAGGNCVPRMFALENELEGEGIDDDYAAAERVQVWFPKPGDIVNALLADGEDVDIGDYLESNGDGMLKEHVADKESWESGSQQEGASITVYPEQIVGVAVEDVDISGSSGEESSGAQGYDKRIKVQIV